jgi:hypothetical protein
MEIRPHWLRVCVLALIWPFLIVLPLLVIFAITAPEAFTLTLSWDERPVVETQSPLLVAVFIGVPCFALWLGAIWGYRALVRVRELDGSQFLQAVLRRALFGFVGALALGSVLSLIYKRAGIPRGIVAGFLTPGMGCWQLLVSAIPALDPLVQSKSSIICVSVLFTAVFFSLVAGSITALHLRWRRPPSA